LHGLRDHAARLADAVGAVLDQGAFPIVLGGDCTILLGITLTLRRRARSGLLFLDGHADCYQPEAEPTGEAASMELGLVTGRGPELLTDLEGRRPLAPTIHSMDLPTLRRRGVEPALADALSALPAPPGRPGGVLGPLGRRRPRRRGHARGRLPPPRRAHLGPAGHRPPGGRGHRPRR